MDIQAIITLVVPVVLTILAHRYDVIDLGKAAQPAAPGQLPPPVVPLPNRPTLQLLEQKLEQLVLEAVHSKLDAIVAPAVAPAPAVAQK